MGLRKSIREKLGLPPLEEHGDTPKIMMSSIQVPLDLMFEILIRDHNQLHQEMGNLNGRVAASEAIIAASLETMEHLHNDVIELQQALQAAAQHPVEHVDEVTAAKAEKDKKLN